MATIATHFGGQKKVAKNLLSDDGVIFISIDENEVHNMRKICDEIFGEANFISQLGWQKVYSPKNQARYFSNDYEFVLCYCKNINNFSSVGRKDC